MKFQNRINSMMILTVRRCGSVAAAPATVTTHRAVLRLPGESEGADEDRRLAKQLGLAVYYWLEDVPGCSATSTLLEK